MLMYRAVLQHLYGELVGKSWELSGVTDLPDNGYFFSSTTFDQMWVSIRFRSVGHSCKLATMTLYVPGEQLVDGKYGVYLVLIAYDRKRTHVHDFTITTGFGKDRETVGWCGLITQRALELKSLIEQLYARGLTLKSLRQQIAHHLIYRTFGLSVKHQLVGC